MGQLGADAEHVRVQGAASHEWDSRVGAGDEEPVLDGVLGHV